MNTLKGRQVLVTGAASGIGLECARSFARRGADLVVSDINGPALENARVEIAATGVQCFAMTCDVSQEASVADFAASVQQQAGPAQLESLMSNPEVANRELGGGKVKAKFAQSYREFVSLPSAQAEFGKLYRGLLDRDKVPAVFHCTTAKDRTGWAAAAFLTLLGVPEDQVYADYLRSNDYILPADQQAIDGFVAAGGDAEIPRAILGVKREYLESTRARPVAK